MMDAANTIKLIGSLFAISIALSLIVGKDSSPAFLKVHQKPMRSYTDSPNQIRFRTSLDNQGQLGSLVRIQSLSSKRQSVPPQEIRLPRTPPRNAGDSKVVIIGQGTYGFHGVYSAQCNCDGDRIDVTYDTTGVKMADVVIYTVGASKNMTQGKWRHYNKVRKPSQLWILAARESPISNIAVRPPTEMMMAYNLSFTYHSRSNFPTPYGWFTLFDTPRNVSRNYHSEKSKLIQWSSSHCNLSGRHYKRTEFVYTLREYLNITMYGKCGDGPFFGEDYLTAVRDHKFVIVMENSCCSEYITEKLWNALILYESVPVVYGATREEYERIAPPNSFVFIQDFSSVQELADYIEEVGSDERRYNEYHDWRRLGYGKKQKMPDDRIYHCHSICRLSETIKEAKKGKMFQFDEKGDVYYGGCRNCQDEVNVLLTANRES